MNDYGDNAPLPLIDGHKISDDVTVMSNNRRNEADPGNRERLPLDMPGATPTGPC